MPRYFFDIQDHAVIIDDTGTELPNDEAARVQAIISCGEYLTDHPQDVWPGNELRVHVYGPMRAPLFLLAVFGVDLQRGQERRG